jgi:hypothetical protein
LQWWWLSPTAVEAAEFAKQMPSLSMHRYRAANGLLTQQASHFDQLTPITVDHCLALLL